MLFTTKHFWFHQYLTLLDYAHRPTSAILLRKLHTSHNTHKYLLKQWIALKMRPAWLLKLHVAFAIHLQAICAGFACENVVLVAGIHQLKSYFVLHRLAVSVYTRTTIHCSVGGWQWILPRRFAARLISTIMINQIYLFACDWSKTITRPYISQLNLGNIRGYYPSDIHQFLYLASIIISLLKN